MGTRQRAAVPAAMCRQNGWQQNREGKTGDHEDARTLGKSKKKEEKKRGRLAITKVLARLTGEREVDNETDDTQQDHNDKRRDEFVGLNPAWVGNK